MNNENPLANRSSMAYTSYVMPDRSRKADLNLLAKSIVDGATGQEEAEDFLAKAEAKGKNVAAVALGRLGGLKGGKARAKKLSAKKRSEIARKAAAARWGGSDTGIEDDNH